MTPFFPGEILAVVESLRRRSGAVSPAVDEEENGAGRAGSAEDEALLARMTNKTQTGGGAADPKAIGYHGHKRQFENFLAAMMGKTPLLIDGPEGRRAVELILAIYQAAETGKAVQLPLPCNPVLTSRR